jgi:hypothetical protein
MFMDFLFDIYNIGIIYIGAVSTIKEIMELSLNIDILSWVFI